MITSRRNNDILNQCQRGRKICIIFPAKFRYRTDGKLLIVTDMKLNREGDYNQILRSTTASSSKDLTYTSANGRSGCFSASCVVFVTGRGGAGFHPRGPAATRARGAFFRVIPAPSPVRGESPLIPWTEPRFSPPKITGARLGNGRGRRRG